MSIANYLIETTFVVTMLYPTGGYVCVIYLLQVEHISQQHHQRFQAPLVHLSVPRFWQEYSALTCELTLTMLLLITLCANPDEYLIHNFNDFLSYRLEQNQIQQTIYKSVGFKQPQADEDERVWPGCVRDISQNRID